MLLHTRHEIETYLKREIERIGHLLTLHCVEVMIIDGVVNINTVFSTTYNCKLTVHYNISEELLINTRRSIMLCDSETNVYREIAKKICLTVNDAWIGCVTDTKTAFDGVVYNENVIASNLINLTK